MHAEDPPLPPPLLMQMLRDLPSRAVVIDRHHRYVFANRAALEFLNLPEEAVIGRTIGEVRGERTMQNYLGVVDALFERRESLHWEGWTDYLQRGRCYTEEWLMPYGEPGQPVSLVLGYARDLTELKRQTQALEEQVAAVQRAEQIKLAIVEHALAAIVSADEHGRIVEFNPAAEAMFGIGRAETLGRDLVEVVVPPHHRTGRDHPLQRLVSGGAAPPLGQRLKMQAVRADGQEFPAEIVLWQTSVGGTTFHTAAINDLSEQLRAAEVIDRQRDALRQSEKLGAMGSLLAGVAHELNNPLSIVLGRAGLLEEKAAGGALAADALSIREAAERCGRIVRTFLNMARSRPPQRSAVSLNDLAAAAADLMQYGLRTHGITLELQLDPALPAVPADPDQVGQVVLNLVVNAQQALMGSEGARRLVIATGHAARNAGAAPHVWLRVADNGPGVAEALRERIFEPFVTTKPEGLGTGLGLSVSRTISREHGGELVLEAVPGPGASFRLSLPMEAVREPERASPAPVADAAPESAGRVLVVDDESEIADLMRAFLESAGYDVATAESGAVALELLATARFDAIVSDLRMPDIDGATLWREVARRWPPMARRMLFVTGDTLSPGVEGFLREAGCIALDKPFARKELLAQVQRLVSGG
ncbi:MAG: PAS domain S-box protein [Rubrivivax sp.]|nr:PAS domain S-box protein [Rubrivivax sp.]